ncbi:MAG: flagellar filament capping protein FliD [Verrucomicrobiota bacterium]
MSVSLGGFFSGIDSSSLIQQLTALNRQPEQVLSNQKNTLASQSTAYNAIQTSMSSLRGTVTALNDSSLYSSKAATSSDSAKATVSVDYTAVSSSTTINITQVATNSILTGGSSTGSIPDTKLSAIPSTGSNISKILGTTAYAGQTFTINNSTITLASGDTVSSVLAKMNAVSGVTATYDSTTGKFSLSSGSTILLGSGADTSDFLQRAQLYNNGTGSVTSSIGAGRIDPTTAFTSSDLRSGTALSSGTFTVNGVSIAYSTSDSLTTVLSNINSSTAGVTATYDSYTDRVVLTSKNRGAQNIVVANGTSNVATALRLATTDSSMNIGKATQFTVGNDATVRQSEDQTLTAAELGLTGVTVNAVDTGSVTINVTPDTDKIKKTIDAFVTQYNSVQNLIQSYVKINPADLTQNGLLANDTTVAYLPSMIRSATTDSISSSGTIRMLEDLGVTGNATNNTLTLSDSSKILSALQDHSDEVTAMFTNVSSSLDSRLGSILDSYSQTGTGVLAIRQNSITQQSKDIDDQIARIEAQVLAEEAYMKQQFASLDSVSGQNQQISNVLSGKTS